VDWIGWVEDGEVGLERCNRRSATAGAVNAALASVNPLFCRSCMSAGTTTESRRVPERDKADRLPGGLFGWNLEGRLSSFHSIRYWLEVFDGVVVPVMSPVGMFVHGLELESRSSLLPVDVVWMPVIVRTWPSPVSTVDVNDFSDDGIGPLLVTDGVRIGQVGLWRVSGVCHDAAVQRPNRTR